MLFRHGNHRADSGEIRVVGEASNGREVIAIVAASAPDVVLMDIRMPELDGIAATEQICASGSPSRILILTTFEEDEFVMAALRSGASGFIGKGAEPDAIVRAVRATHLGESLLSPAATRVLITRSLEGHEPRSAAWDDPRLQQVTLREREVLLLVAAGRSNQEIATTLVISPHTAKTHVNRIMSKVHARDRAQLVILAYEMGLVAPGV